MLKQIEEFFHKDKVATAAVLIAAVLSGPLVDEIRDTLGTAIIFHPMTVWVVLFCIVFANTKSFKVSVACLVGYEILKRVWQSLGLEAPKVARVRKILHNVQANAELSENDVHFLNKVTPNNVEVIKKDKV